MSWHVLRALSLLIVLCLCSTTEAQRSRFAETNSRSPYVHWIDLYDAKNNRVDPEDPNAAAYSPLTTCGRCHDYEAIARGHHFNAPLPGAYPGRPGEPWIWTDDRTATQIPLSYRGWKGTYDPRQLGISNWDFVLKFGRHLPGGGPGEELEAADPAAGTSTAATAAEPAKQDAETDDTRWKLSGWLNVDCMFCHGGDQQYSPEAWWDQISNQNFAWAPTAAAGLGAVEGKVSSLPDSFDPANPPSGSRNQLPKTTYTNLKRNAEKEVFLDIVRRPGDHTCYYCHTTRPVGEGAAPAWVHDEDVHLRAGMLCSDCHRNGIGHETVRGFEGETHPSGESVATLSCRGCHLGEAGAGGRLGAPRPLHKGLPALHLDRISCTGCHAGPPPGEQAQQIQTALAHGLGLPSHDYVPEMAPGIVSPVLIQDAGTLYPNRMMWPAFWGKLSGETITPLNPDAVYENLRRILRVRRGETLLKTLSDVKLTAEEKEAALGADRAKTPEAELTEDEKAKLAALIAPKTIESWREKLAESLESLKQLVTEDGAIPVYVAGGKAYRTAADGTAQAFENAAAKPYAWKLGHDVRPAYWSSGITGCYECHAAGTPILTSQVTAISPVPDPEPLTRSMYEFTGYDKQKHDAWNLTFPGRPIFKYAGFAAMSIVALVLAAYLLDGVRGFYRMFRRD